MATVRFWAGARRAAGHAEEQTDARSIGELRTELAARPALAALSAVVTFLIEGTRADDEQAIPAGCLVDVLPPFAGG
jgi:molybdopterin converting factor small subunit